MKNKNKDFTVMHSNLVSLVLVRLCLGMLILPSVIFYNPAGMALLRGTNISQPFALIVASTKVKDTGTTRVQDMGQAPDTADSADCNAYDCMSDPNPSPAMMPSQ